MRLYPLGIVFLIAISGLCPSRVLADTPYPDIAPTEPNSPEDERKSFKVPPGFEVQLVASEPDIRKPIQMAFDAKGRLWVATSEEYPFPAVGRPGKDRLYILEDFGPDGKAKKISIFADDLNIPIGILPLPDCKSVIVSGIDPGPNKDSQPTCWIWKLTDTTGAGKYDKKEKLYGPFGCDDTHGTNNSYTLMPDGWVYACHGYRNNSRPKGKDGSEIFMNSGNTFRFRPDGSHIEIWTHGQVNPFGIAVDPYFNLYTADCHSKPITQLIHGATYTSFSKPHDGLGFAPHVTIHGHDSTALCGLVYYAADHFPKEYLDCMFLGNVTSNCINLDKIEFAGSTPKGIEQPNFLTTKDIWFRPVDIKLGPDGALYFSDFYNRIIGHYEVPLTHPGRDKLRGRVWRIVWKGLDGKADAPKMMPDLTQAKISAVHALTGDRNLTVRLLATHQVRLRQKEFLALVADEVKNKGSYQPQFTCPEEGQADRLWCTGGQEASEFSADDYAAAIKQGMLKWGPLYFVHYLRHAVATTAPSDALRHEIDDCLNHPSAFVRRTAVDALIMYPDRHEIRPLLDLLAKTPPADDHLRMAIRVALRESTRLLDDWDKAAGAIAWTPADIKVLADIAPAAPTAAASQFLAKHFGELAGDASRLAVYVEHAARYASDADTQSTILAFVRDHKPTDLRLSIVLLNAYQQALQKRGKTLAKPDEVAFAERLCAKAIAAADAVTVRAGIDLAASLKLASAFDALANLAAKRAKPEGQRLAALAAIASIDAVKAVPIIVKLLNDANDSIVLREKTAPTLVGMNRADGLDELVKALQTAPARLQTAIALAMAGNAAAAEKLLAAVESGKASARLLQNNTVQTRLRESKLPGAAGRVATLTKGLPSADERMLQLMGVRRAGFAKAKADAVLGKQAFTKNCAICHQIGNEGTKIGPQLDGIGGRGLDRLLEDILDPSRNVDAAFRTTIVTLKDGKNLSGLVLREEGAILVLADDKGKEVRVAKDDIDEKRTSQLSPMPANVADIISEKDFYDLMAYLLTQQAKDKKEH